MGRFVLVNANVYIKLILSPRWASSLCAAKFQLVKKLEMECILSLDNNLLRLTPESCISTYGIISIFYDKSYNWFCRQSIWHDIVSVQYSDVIISVMASLITGVSLFTQPFVQAQMKKKHQSPASLVFVRAIQRWPVNYPHKGPATRKMFPFDEEHVFEWITTRYFFGDWSCTRCIMNQISNLDHRLLSITFPYFILMWCQIER